MVLVVLVTLPPLGALVVLVAFVLVLAQLLVLLVLPALVQLVLPPPLPPPPVPPVPPTSSAGAKGSVSLPLLTREHHSSEELPRPRERSEDLNSVFSWMFRVTGSSCRRQASCPRHVKRSRLGVHGTHALGAPQYTQFARSTGAVSPFGLVAMDAKDLKRLIDCEQLADSRYPHVWPTTVSIGHGNHGMYYTCTNQHVQADLS